MHVEEPLQKKQQHSVLLQCLDKEGADEPHTVRPLRDLERDGAIANSFSDVQNMTRRSVRTTINLRTPS